MRPTSGSGGARLAALLFVSGFCALVYQTAWLRSLRLVFGASTTATAVVLGIFMAGLGFGGLRLGRRADRHPRPLGLYASLEAGIAVAAALSPLLVDLARRAYLATGGVATLGGAGATALRLALSAAVLGVPAFLMGGTLPALARAAETAADPDRRRVGLLYGWNTLGAVAGALATTFLLIELLGVRRTIWVAAGLNLIVAVVARAWSRDGGAVEAAAASSPAPPAASRGFVLAAAFAVGFVFLAMELVWYRMLAPLLGGSTYTFGVVLAVALAGIGAGGLAFAAAAPLAPSRAAFAWSCAVEALALAAPFAAGDRIADLALGLRGFASWGFGPLVATWALVAAAVVFLPAFAAGYQFPLLVALLGRGEREVGREVGAAYAANTAGAIAGSLAGGFVLLPLLGAPGLWRSAVAALAALALIALVQAAAGGAAVGRRAIGPAAAALLALAAAVAAGPTAGWRHRPIGAGRVEYADLDRNDLVRQANAARRSVTWEADGREVSVAMQTANGTAFLINGKADGHSIHDADTQVMSGLIGAVLHPEPRSALVIGLGTGSTAGWLAAVPTIERVDVAEIEPAIVEVARACAPVNRDVLADPKVRLLLEDAREVLQTSRASWDIVFSEPSNPYRVGISSLYSREFYDHVRSRLGPSGVFLQWLQGYEIDAGLVRTVYATMVSVFGAVETWQVGEADLLLVASAAPIAHDFERAARRVAEEPLRSAMSWTWGVEGVGGFYAGRIAGPAFAAALAAGAGERIELDDRPRLEFGFAHNLGRSGRFSIRELRALAAAAGERRSPASGAGPTEEELAEALGARLLAEMAAAPEVEAAAEGHPALAGRARARRAWSEARFADAARAWDGGAATQPIERTLVAETLAFGGDERALELLAEVGRRSPPEAALIEALLRMSRRETAAAAEAFARGFEALRGRPWAYPPLVERSLVRARLVGSRDPAAAARLVAALERPFAVHASDELRLLVRLDLVKRGDFAALCREAIAPLERWPLWEEGFLADRVACHRRHGGAALARAERDLERFRAALPPRLSDWRLAPAVPGQPTPGAVP